MNYLYKLLMCMLSLQMSAKSDDQPFKFLEAGVIKFEEGGDHKKFEYDKFVEHLKKKGCLLSDAKKVAKFTPLRSMKPLEVFYTNFMEVEKGRSTYDAQILIYEEIVFIMIMKPYNVYMIKKSEELKK